MSRFLLKFGRNVAKAVQGSRLDVVGLVEILLRVKSHINDNNTSISLPARNLRKEINIKTIQRNYDENI